MAIDEARSVARRPMSPALKVEREEFLHRAHLALGQSDKVVAALANADTPGTCRVVSCRACVRGGETAAEKGKGWMDFFEIWECGGLRQHSAHSSVAVASVPPSFFSFTLLIHSFLLFLLAGLKALYLKAQFDALTAAAAGSSSDQHESAQRVMCDQAKSLVGGGAGASSSMAQLVVAQLLLSAGQLKEALQLVHAGATPEHSLLALQLYLKLDRLDLAKTQHSKLLQVVDDDFVLAQLASVYVGLALGSSGAADVLHSLTALSEQYGPSPYLLNLMACALLQQGDANGAEQKLLECYRDHLNEGSLSPPHPLIPDTLINLITCCIQQGKSTEAQTHLQLLHQRCPLHPFCVGVERVQSAFTREAIKYKV